MKGLLIFTIAFVILPNLNAQEDVLFSSMEKNDIAGIIDLLDARVELCIEDSQELYTKRDAIRKLQNWLKEVKPKNLQAIHSGESEDNHSHYKVGKLITEKGVFRVFVYIENIMSNPLVRKIQIDKF